MSGAAPSNAAPNAASAGHSSTHAVAKPNKPSNSGFRQQRLVAWQPIMSPPHVVACLLVVAIAFVPVGIAILYANNAVQDFEFQYDTQSSCSLTHNDGLFEYFPPGATTPSVSMGCNTVVNFTLANTMTAPVFLYYRLTNFYQNHRRFAKSMSATQFAGQSASGSSISDCDPFSTPGQNNGLGSTVLSLNSANTTYGTLTYNPCGLVPWSMFNDSFILSRWIDPFTRQVICDGTGFSKFDNTNTTPQQCHKHGITWASDADKYKVPVLSDTYWTANRAYYNKPLQATTDPYLLNGWYAGEPGHEVPVTTDEDLQVWARTASLPDFRKLYRVIDVDLPPGNYVMQIREFFPVSSFGGSKSFVLSTISWLGGKNQFLGIAYLVVGALSVVLAVAFFLVYKINGDRMQRAIDSLSELQ